MSFNISNLGIFRPSTSYFILVEMCSRIFSFDYKLRVPELETWSLAARREESPGSAGQGAG